MCVACICIFVGGHAYMCEEARAECQIPFSKTLSLFLRQGLSMNWTLIILAMWPIEFLKSACLYVACLCPCTLNAGTTDVHAMPVVFMCALVDGAQTLTRTARCLSGFLPVVLKHCTERCRQSSKKTEVRGILQFKIKK